MGHYGAFSNEQTLVSFLHKEIQTENAQAMIKTKSELPAYE